MGIIKPYPRSYLGYAKLQASSVFLNVSRLKTGINNSVPQNPRNMAFSDFITANPDLPGPLEGWPPTVLLWNAISAGTWHLLPCFLAFVLCLPFLLLRIGGLGRIQGCKHEGSTQNAGVPGLGNLKCPIVSRSISTNSRWMCILSPLAPQAHFQQTMWHSQEFIRIQQKSLSLITLP